MTLVKSQNGIFWVVRKKKEMGRPLKPEEKKLKHKIQVSLTETDFSDFEEFKKEDHVDGDSDAMRRFFRWAMSRWKEERGPKPPPGSP